MGIFGRVGISDKVREVIPNWESKQKLLWFVPRVFPSPFPNRMDFIHEPLPFYEIIGQPQSWVEMETIGFHKDRNKELQLAATGPPCYTHKGTLTHRSA